MSLPLHGNAQAANMARDEPEWGAAKVRQTFLDYFTKKNGHTFGASTSQFQET
jgi:alanyl-tRNA synthetase